MQYIDLHTHSTVSDGTETPAAVVAQAYKLSLSAVALTDHDTIAGLPEALAAGRELAMEVVSGVEIAVDAGVKGGMHMVGLLFDHEHDELNAALDRLLQAREERNLAMAAKFKEHRMDITLDYLAGLAGGDLISRAHMAQALVDKGYCGNRQEAFARYIGEGAKLYVPKAKLTPADAIALIRRAGGVSVLAHPGLMPIGKGHLETVISELKEMGLDALEAYYTEHDSSFTNWAVRMAAKHDLALSGGSDFHGGPKPEVKLGFGKGGLRVPAYLLETLRKRADVTS
jgi:predicted metal-dependent phosphoesterase TrpH